MRMTGGMTPSVLIVKRMRVWPYIVTRVIEKIEMTAPAARIVPGMPEPVTSLRIWASPASWCWNFCHGCAPTAARATST